MAMTKPLLGVALASFLCAVATEATSREIRFKTKCSGTATSIHWDTNRDGLRAGMGTVACISNLGRSTAQGVGEAVVAGPATCPNGNPGINLTLFPGTGHAVGRYERTGDMIFSELTSETVCFDPSTGMQFKSGTTRITGGTGRFAGATGETRFEGTQRPLYVDADRNGFAAPEETSTGTIILRGD